MTDNPFASQSPGATLPPPDVPNQTSDVPAQNPDAPIRPLDATPPPTDAATPGVPAEFAPYVSTDAAPDSRMVSLDVPIEVMDAGDGKKAEIIGDVDRLKGLIAQQGDNPYGFRGDCGLVSCRNVFKQFGLESTEASVAGYAASHGLCDTGRPGDPPESCGGSTPLEQAKILSDNGVPAHASEGRSLDDLAGYVQEGRGVIVEVNAGILWNDPDAVEDGKANHAVTVIGVVRDPSTQAIEGFVLNDSGNGKTEVVSADLMNQCFVQKGGVCVTTDHSAPRAS